MATMKSGSEMAKNQNFLLFLSFLRIDASSDPNFFFERNCMMLENVLYTQNMVVGRQENFLRRLEVDFHSLKAVFRSHGDPEIWFRKVKNPKKFTFLEFSQDWCVV